MDGANIILKTPSEVRGLLLATAVGVIEGRVTVAQANSVVGLSCEVHKSLKQEWDMRNEYAEAIQVEHGVVSTLIEDKGANDG